MIGGYQRCSLLSISHVQAAQSHPRERLPCFSMRCVFRDMHGHGIYCLLRFTKNPLFFGSAGMGDVHSLTSGVKMGMSALP